MVHSGDKSRRAIIKRLGSSVIAASLLSPIGAATAETNENDNQADGRETSDEYQGQIQKEIRSSHKKILREIAKKAEESESKPSEGEE